ncbi:hypothetical protein J1N35_011788 [Gossypium stocksii]|uniref:Uncharacterized protein n=1 Tax=Gossypium stocksii TaxID=47602 RepID=A0A9D3W4P3_9ROSI|nr:hypothetical protein J1N35_011788 [Gossypium stocksii]
MYSGKEILYERTSGLAINFVKSGIMFSSNTSGTIQDSVKSMLGINSPIDHGRYLELPLLVGRNKRQVFAFIKKHFSKCIFHWQNKLLSWVSKKVLIKNVA